MINEKNITLRQVLKEVYYSKKDNVNADDFDKDNYFATDQTKKLKSIFKSLNINIEKFKDIDSNNMNGNENYNIPIVVAEVFKQYLLEDSSKKSFISKIKNKKFLDITFSEKEKFIKKVIDGLKERCKDFDNTEKAYEELEKISDKWVEEAKFNETIKEKVIKTKFWTNLIIEAGFIHIGGISDLDGLVLVNDNIFEKDINDQVSNDKLFDEMKQIDDSKIKYRVDLTPSDRFELINYFLIMIKDTLISWKNIADIACEIRNENVLESNIISSEKLIQSAITEYKNRLKKKSEVKDIPNFEREKLGKILEEIKLEMEKNK